MFSLWLEDTGYASPLTHFFVVEFNEDLSAFHGTTGPGIESQILYTSRAVTTSFLYIQRTPPSSSSWASGVVETSLLPSVHISAIITMSTPHALPHARFDSLIDEIYRRNRLILDSDPTPILSLCGGATDMMISSESCVLEKQGAGAMLRRTVSTSALEGAYSGCISQTQKSRRGFRLLRYVVLCFFLLLPC
jgi:GPI inositol-deacylase